MKLSKTTVISAAKDQISCDLAGEAAILNFKSGSYYGLNAIGARVWDLVQKPISVAAIIRSVTDEYAVEADVFERDLAVLLKKMEAEGLITASDEPAP
jgi:hypothetical protein